MSPSVIEVARCYMKSKDGVTHLSENGRPHLNTKYGPVQMNGVTS